MGHLKLMDVKIFNQRGNVKFPIFDSRYYFNLKTRISTRCLQVKKREDTLQCCTLEVCFCRSLFKKGQSFFSWEKRWTEGWNFIFFRIETSPGLPVYKLDVQTRLGVGEITVGFVITLLTSIRSSRELSTCFGRRVCNILVEAEVLKNWGF